MNKEMLKILDDLLKKSTTELTLQIMELSSENLILEQQCKKQKEIIDKAVEYINSSDISIDIRKTDGSLNYVGTDELLDILKEVSE